jgi:ABC-type polysaccharide/polyol phosphate export permease
MELNSKLKNLGRKETNMWMIVLLVFIVLKLTDQIDWSWWWVLSPLWLPFIIGTSIGILVAVIFIVYKLLK